jgi:hypothetical protein
VRCISKDAKVTTLFGVTLMPVLAPSQPTSTGPVLEYDIFTFTSNSTASVTLLISPSQNQNGALRPLKYGVAFDAETPQTIQFVGNYTGSGYPPSWGGRRVRWRVGIVSQRKYHDDAA